MPRNPALEIDPSIPSHIGLRNAFTSRFQKSWLVPRCLSYTWATPHTT